MNRPIPIPAFRDPRKETLGGLITVHDLPKHGTTRRWTPIFKSVIAKAITHKVLTPEEAADRYSTTPIEIKRWVTLLEKYGVRGLMADNLQLNEPISFETAGLIEAGPLVIDCDFETVHLHGKALHFTPNQFRLLTVLVRNTPLLVSRADAYSLLFAGRARQPKIKILDIMVCKMRKKFACNAIETVWGRGYRWLGVQSDAETAKQLERLERWKSLREKATNPKDQAAIDEAIAELESKIKR